MTIIARGTTVMNHEIDEGPAPALPDGEIAQARRLQEQALACRDQGRWTEAEALLRRALDLVDAALGHDHLEAAGLYLGLARLELARGRAAEAEAPARWGLAIRERALGPDHPDVAADRIVLAAILEAQGR